MTPIIIFSIFSIFYQMMIIEMYDKAPSKGNGWIKFGSINVTVSTFVNLLSGVNKFFNNEVGNFELAIIVMAFIVSITISMFLINNVFLNNDDHDQDDVDDDEDDDEYEGFTLISDGNRYFIQISDDAILAELIFFITSKIKGFAPLSVETFDMDLCNESGYLSFDVSGISKVTDANGVEFNFGLNHHFYQLDSDYPVDATELFLEYPYLLKYFSEEN